MGQGKDLKERLFVKKDCGWNDMSKEEMDTIFAYADGYINFLNKAKTEREAVETAKNMVREKGFKCISVKVYYPRHADWRRVFAADYLFAE